MAKRKATTTSGPQEVLYREYWIKPYNFGTGGYWIERHGYTIQRYVETVAHARLIIDSLV